MMDFRTRLEQSKNTPAEPAVPAMELDDNVSCEYFATDRVKNPACLDLRLSGGVRKALPYAYFSELTYDAERGIEIVAGNKKITITGRNLARLFDCLVEYRVRYVQANTGNERNDDGLFVRDIRIEELVR